MDSRIHEDHAPARSRRALIVAAIIALLPVGWATHSAWLSPFTRHASVTVPAPNLASPRPTPTATPTPRPPALLVADRLDLGALRAYGRIDVRGYDHSNEVIIRSYTLSATPGALPAELPVWKLRGFAAADYAPLARALDLPLVKPVSPSTSSNGFDPAKAELWAAYAPLGANPVPSDDASAVAAFTAALRDLGLAPDNADAEVRAESGTPPSTWYLSLVRRPVNGIPVGLHMRDGLVTADVDDRDSIHNLSVHEMAIDGGSMYPLRSWREAWTDVSRGHWFDECCWVFTGGPGGPMKASFRADRVSLIYESPLGTPDYLVPFYAFTDTHNDFSLSVPALRLSDLAERGGFLLTEPGAR